MQLDLNWPTPVSDELCRQVWRVESHGSQRPSPVINLRAGISDEWIKVGSPHQTGQLRSHQRCESEMTVGRLRPSHFCVQISTSIHFGGIDRLEERCVLVWGAGRWKAPRGIDMSLQLGSDHGTREVGNCLERDPTL